MANLFCPIVTRHPPWTTFGSLPGPYVTPVAAYLASTGRSCLRRFFVREPQWSHQLTTFYPHSAIYEAVTF